MQSPLDYRGLRRWSMLILFPVLILSSWVAALLFCLLALPLIMGPMSATAIAGGGIAVLVAMIVPPVVGTLAGLLRIANSKNQAVRHFKASRMPSRHLLVQDTSDLAAKLGMKCPEVYVYEDDDINAWATGTSASNAAIGITRAALNRLNREQVLAVIGHELGHIAAADIRRMQFALGFQNALVWFFGLRSWRWNAQHIFGFVGQFGIMGLSRRREYWADAIGGVLTSPEAMKSALLAVQHDAQQPKRRRKYFNQLLFNWRGGNLLASHPTMAQRCAALDQGAFEAAVLRKMGANTSRRSKSNQNKPQSAEGFFARLESMASAWEERPILLAVTPVAILLLFGGLYFYAYEAHQREVGVAAIQIEPIVALSSQPTSAPQVAGWVQESPKGDKTALDAVTPVKAPETVPLPAYPKEPPYEPDDSSGDGELTPYQMLVENGIACIYRSNTDLKSEHYEDAGPAKSDLMVYTLPASEPHSELILGVIGASITGCWKKEGGRQAEPDMMKRVTLKYDVWTLADAKSGATAECGIWPVAGRIHNGLAGIAAYCR